MSMHSRVLWSLDGSSVSQVIFPDSGIVIEQSSTNVTISLGTTLLATYTNTNVADVVAAAGIHYAHKFTRS